MPWWRDVVIPWWKEAIMPWWPMPWWGWLAIGAALMVVLYTLYQLKRRLPLNHPIQVFFAAAILGAVLFGLPLWWAAWFFDW